MEVQKGLRVVRGPNWSWGDQDGGEGHVGTVVDTQSVTRDQSEGGSETRVTIVTVQWDRGNRCRYRCGVEDKYDLRVFENAPVGSPHPGVSCDGCNQEGAMAGMRWKCAKCYDYDLCTPCYMSGKHIAEHAFVRYDTVRTRTRVLPRRSARKVEARGIFPGAEVVRCQEWSEEEHAGNQGFGKSGKVVDIERWEGESYRSAAHVEWQGAHHRSRCRIGHEGKVDLKCTVPATGGEYFPEHLPVLGAPLPPPDPQEFSSGDYVRVELDQDVLRLMQEGHGGWSSDMGDIRGKLGVIHSVLDNGDLSVLYGSKRWTLNPVSVVKVDIWFARGDVVRVMDDMAEVTKLQQGHGEWNEYMAMTVGQLGLVEGVNNAGNAIVNVKGRHWIFNPLCLSAAPDEKAPDMQNEVLGEDVDLLRLSMLALVEDESSDFLAHAALLGEDSMIRDYLEKYPNEVNAKFCGKTALHCAAAAGKVSVMKMLFEFQADVEIEDDDGLRPLHHCVIRDETEAIKVLLDAGADPNSQAQDGNTALTIAALKGSNNVLTLLANHPKIDLSAQDSSGDTALHCAVHAKNHKAVRILLEAGADPTLVNFKLITSVHLASSLGFTTAMEEFITRFPQHLNLRIDDGLTPLHVAAMANHRDIVTYLAEQKCCDIDSRTIMKHTPLHMAIMRGKSRIVEHLVGYGADLNAVDSDEDTPLHLVLNAVDDTPLRLVLGRDEVDAPSDETPELMKVQDALDQDDGTIVPGVVLACFLVREGSDILLTNKNGLTPLQMCSKSPENVAKVLEFAEKHAGTGTFHGSLCPSAAQPQTPTSVLLPTVTNAPPVQTKDVKPEMKQPTCLDPSSTTVIKIPPPSLPDSATSESTPATTSESNPAATSESNPAATSESNPAATSESNPAPEEQKQSPQPLSDQETENVPKDAELCLLCDTPITIKFDPCEHSVVCEQCARRASKCPECKVPIQAIVKLKKYTGSQVDS